MVNGSLLGCSTHGHIDAEAAASYSAALLSPSSWRPWRSIRACEAKLLDDKLRAVDCEMSIIPYQQIGSRRRRLGQATFGIAERIEDRDVLGPLGRCDAAHDLFAGAV